MVAKCGRSQTLAFPGAQGFGRLASGGRNGAIYHVTSLADSGTGTFRDAVSQPNRCIVFDVGGVITLESIVACSANLSIEGQTAPGGIAIIGHEVSFSLQTNEIVRYLRVRPGVGANSKEDGINLGDGTNLIFDHVSIEFAPYNNIDAHGNYTDGNDITIQNSILADPIGQQFNAHTEASNNNFSWCYNIFSSAHDRNPLAKVNTIFLNNVVYNYQAGYTVANTMGIFSHDIVNNYFISGPATTSINDDFFQFNSGQSVYASGNLLDASENGVLAGSPTAPGGVTVLNAPWSALTAQMPTFATTSAFRYDVSWAGAFPRDQVDQLVVGEVASVGTAGQGQALWTNQAQTGLGNNGFGTITGGVAPLNTSGDGLPDYWKLAMGLSTNVAYPTTNTADGYTLQEHYFNWLAGPNAVTLKNATVAVDLWGYTAGFTNGNATYTLGSVSNGVASLNNGHVVEFTPSANFVGLGSFQFAVAATDGSAYSNTVTICVTPVIPPGGVNGGTPPATTEPAIFVCLNSATSGGATVSISPPAGGGYSAADQVDSGTVWNNLSYVAATKGSTAPGNPETTATTNSLWGSPVSLVNSVGNSAAAKLTISNYYGTAGSAAQFTAVSQTGGDPASLGDGVWRIYYGTDYATYQISGLIPNSPYDLYFYGCGDQSGQGVTLALGLANRFGGHASAATTSGAVTAAVFDGDVLTNAGVVWNVLHGAADTNGNFVFTQSSNGSGDDFFNGFQLQPLAVPVITGLSNVTAPAGGSVTWTAVVTGLPTPVLQWQTNGINLADTENSLTLTNLEPVESGVYSLIASNSAGITTNSVNLSITPQPPPSLAAAVLSDGTVQLSLTGEAGQAYRVWASTNVCLTPVTNAWTLLSAGVFGGGAVLWVDTQATNLMQRFYSITSP